MSYIAVVNYEVGNIKSICNAFEKVGAEVILTNDRSQILGADGVVLPGVGAFSHGMDKLAELGLVETLLLYASTGKPLMGVCLGMQLLFEQSSEFGWTEGLGLIPGEVVALKTYDEKHEKLPHVSWNELLGESANYWQKTILDGLLSGENMYFVHSFVAVPRDAEDVLSTTIYSGNEFCSSVKRDNIYGCQFHPEKSASAGLKLIRNFVNICKV